MSVYPGSTQPHGFYGETHYMSGGRIVGGDARSGWVVSHAGTTSNFVPPSEEQESDGDESDEEGGSGESPVPPTRYCCDDCQDCCSTMVVGVFSACLGLLSVTSMFANVFCAHDSRAPSAIPSVLAAVALAATAAVLMWVAVRNEFVLSSCIVWRFGGRPVAIIAGALGVCGLVFAAWTLGSWRCNDFKYGALPIFVFVLSMLHVMTIVAVRGKIEGGLASPLDPSTRTTALLDLA